MFSTPVRCQIADLERDMEANADRVVAGGDFTGRVMEAFILADALRAMLQPQAGGLVEPDSVEHLASLLRDCLWGLRRDLKR